MVDCGILAGANGELEKIEEPNKALIKIEIKR